MDKTTSWGGVAKWYDTHLEGDTDTYHAQVLAPNIVRIAATFQGMKALDLACGQGVFSRLLRDRGAEVFASDISPELISHARTKGETGIDYHVSPAHALPFVSDASMDFVLISLAIQNIENPRDVFLECARVLKKTGKILLILNHPAFRIPKQSSWGFDEEAKTQYRRIDRYLSESRADIEMHPGSSSLEHTVSFHRPMQWYAKAVRTAGLCIAGMEEWISHKTSDSGPRQEAENRARKEIPLFLALEIIPRP